MRADFWATKEKKRDEMKNERQNEKQPKQRTTTNKQKKTKQGWRK